MIAALCGAAAALLVVSGAAKLRRPHPAAAMLVAVLGSRSVGASRSGPVRRLPAPLVARTTGLVEIAVGAAVLGSGGRVATALLAAAYLAFAAVTLRLLALARSGGPRVSCGCFGRDDTPAGRPHLVLNLIATAVAVAGVVAPPGRLAGLPAQSPAVAVAGALQILLLTWLAYLAVTALPALAAARRTETR